LHGTHEFARPRFQFLKQAHVLDGDHGLVGKGLNQINLPLSK